MLISDIKEKYQNHKLTKKHILHMSRCMTGKEDKKTHYLSMIIKQVHAIEKGLSMQDIRLGFGLSRVKLMLDYIDAYVNLGGNIHYEEIAMAYSVLDSYITIHENVGYIDESYSEIKERIKAIFSSYVKPSNDFGGTVTIYPNEKIANVEAFEELVNTRHSIRDFKKVPVDDAKLYKAIKLAMRAPSACNRQSTRVYVLDHHDFECISGWTGGVKTFLDSVDKMIIITGQMGAYEKNENWQYVVSSSIFAGYLTLAIHAVGLGACLLQRSIVCDSAWMNVAKKLGIPKDEQVVCAMAVGVPCDEVKVPLSHRLEFERIVKYVGDYYTIE